MKGGEQKCHDALCPWLHVDIFDRGQERNVGWINKKIDPTQHAEDFGAASPTDWNLD
jgi:hypothetical protein